MSVHCEPATTRRFEWLDVAGLAIYSERLPVVFQHILISSYLLRRNSAAGALDDAATLVEMPPSAQESQCPNRQSSTRLPRWQPC